MTPDGWQGLSLGDVLTLRYGKALPEHQRVAGQFPVYGSNGPVGTHQAALVKGPGIIVGRKGTAGSVHYCVSDFWPIDTTYFVQSERADFRWLQYALANAKLPSLSEATGIPGMSRNTAYALRFLLPPLPEQRKIAAILLAVDEVIEKTEVVVESLHTLRKAMMQELLTRGAPGQHTRFKQTAIGEIPEEWEVATVGTLGTVKLGRMRSPIYSSGRPRTYLRVANVLDDQIDGSDVLEMLFDDDAFENFRLQPGDILLNEGQSLNLVGRSAIYRGVPPDCAFQKTLLRFRAGPRIRGDFAQLLFQSDLYSGRFAENAVQTTSIAHLTQVRFAAMQQPLPSLPEQDDIVARLNSVGARVRAEYASLQRIGVLKAALMSVLLTGKLRVTSDEGAA
jgi:type I restriction enzyme S subunit